MAVPVALLQALPVVLDATCRPAGRAGLRKAVEFACGPRSGGFLGRTLQTGLYYSAGPLVPVVCKMGGAPAVDPLLDKLCDAPRGEVADKLVALEAKSRGGLSGLGGAQDREDAYFDALEAELRARGLDAVEIRRQLISRESQIIDAIYDNPLPAAVMADRIVKVGRGVWPLRWPRSGTLQFAGFFGGA